MSKSAPDENKNRAWRTTRLEALTDTVFGFSIALLAVSVEVPENFSTLLETMVGFVGFAPSFALIILVWYYHYQLFRRYKVEDGLTIFLNVILLFVVLFYVYPLKYLFSVIAQMMGGDFPLAFEEISVLMAIYSAGFVAVFVVLAFMYHHVYRLRGDLGLTADEAVTAAAYVSDCVVMVGVGLLATVIALTFPSKWAGPVAGCFYFLIAPAQILSSRHFHRKKASLAPKGNT